MFPKRNRLPLSDFPFYFHAFTLYKTPELYFYFQPSLGFRIAVVVSKKVSRQAVARNHLRRQLHHLVKAHFPHQTLPLDLVIVTKPLSITLDHTQLEALITQFTNHIKSHVYTS